DWRIVYDRISSEDNFKENPFSAEAFGEYFNAAANGAMGAAGPSTAATIQKRNLEVKKRQSENIYNVGISLIDAEEEQFNSILSDIRKQAVLQVLADSIESNRDYDSEFDYSEKIESNIALFDNAIGYGVAVSVLELLQSSKRINADERSVQLSMASLKLELEGFTNESGHIVSKGIRYYYQSAIKKISKAFYPTTYAIKSATNNW
ncbi:MAG: hypothetical protein EB154_07720, partial [Nitrosopumilaceae archaeon]|nr:hypothetical protein [Nitrosopumilaceae archaeon]